MKQTFYGSVQQAKVDAGDELGRHVEDIALKGFTVVHNCLPSAELSIWREKIDHIYEQQEREFGREALAAIQELNLCRSPLLYDLTFVSLATFSKVCSIVEKCLGEWFILHLQNAIINRPETLHHQGSWHRDIPHLNVVTSRPLAISALWAIDEFSSQTGGTHFLPFTHKHPELPSDPFIEANHIVASVPAGSVIVFDSMLFHRAGVNCSQIIRRAVNHVYTSPIVKQQCDYPRALAGQEPALGASAARILGFGSQCPLNDKAWRLARAAKLQAKP